MKKILAFDVYGTLIDTQGVLTLLELLVGEKALLFSNTWRAKQLEYSFRRALMHRYEHFSVCTEEALNYSCDTLKVSLTLVQRLSLMESYHKLPAFKDVSKDLLLLAQDYQLVAFSNGENDVVEQLLINANIREYFSDVITADEVESFKPSPLIYQHLLKRTNSKAENTWLISSNSFDVIGAKSQALNAVWVNRTNLAVYDPWGIEPNFTINQLDELSQKLTKEVKEG